MDLISGMFGCMKDYCDLIWSISAQTCVALEPTANRRFVDTNLVCDSALRQISFLQRVNFVKLSLSEVVIGAHSCAFTLIGERHFWASQPNASYLG